MSNRSVRVTVEFLEDDEVVDKREIAAAYHRNSADFFSGVVEGTISHFMPKGW